MTLTQMINMIITGNADLTAYVFEDEQDRDEFRGNKQIDALLFAARSPYVFDTFIKDKYANAEVCKLCLVSCNEIDIVIDTGEV